MRGNGKSRFIPTHVGNTTASAEEPFTPPVHPHTRGEHEVRDNDGALIAGSSPHTWGTLSPTPHLQGHPRFIPTHVGNTYPDLPNGGRFRFIPTHVGNTRNAQKEVQA